MRITRTLHVRSARRLSLATLASIGALLATGSVAATASTVDATASPIEYVAATGEANNLTVTDNGTTLTFVDTAAPITATGCTPAGLNAAGTPVVCSEDDVVMSLGDLDDQTSFVGPGNVTFTQYGDAGADTLRGPSAPSYNFLIGDAGADILAGGPSQFDQAYYGTRTATVNVTIDDAANDGEAAEGDNVLSSVEDVVTGSGVDSVTGSAAGNFISTGRGGDTASGGGGDDSLYPGTTTVAGAADGADSMSGGAGVDVVVVDAVGPGPAFAGLPLSATFDDAANDGIAGEGDNYRSDIEDLFSDGGGNDTVVGTSAINILTTSRGDDSITGGPGNDILRSNAGNDSIAARDGYADRIDCGLGTDTAVVDTLDQVAGDCENVQTADAGNANDIPEDNPPAVAFATPVENALVPAGGTTVTVNAADDHGIARVVLIDDGRVVGIDTVAPYAFAYVPTGDDLGANTFIAQAVDGRSQTATALRAVRVGRFTPARVTATVTPSRDRSRPFRFRVRGAVRLPAGVTHAQGCRDGTVKVTAKRGARTVASRSATLRRDCTYDATVAVRSRARLKVRARFDGNAVLTARNSATRSVRAG